MNNVLKSLIGWIIALFIVVMAFRLFLSVLSLAWTVMFELFFIVIIIIVAAPIYVIIKKKFLDKF